ncbi:MAG: prepilin-type N-terminal cleavage/methylation domain-containing protein [Verrucomicrobia bacterium]|nr:prepilin-type N-terminal cleavage/methylation domain-containing protein [Verrucomicrobiota bacterium]MCF7707311.1 prepilin-type N-terminal cleavage/methylation domain-containing protein [Verrucomicrobiota bacterium]
MKTAVKIEAGFTLLEIMIVVCIMAVIMTIGLPAAFSVVEKNPMRQAISDVVEACSHARAKAVFSDSVSAVVINPQSGAINVVRVSSNSGGKEPKNEITLGGGDTDGVRLSGSVFSAELSGELELEMVDVNFTEFKDAERAVVRFYPNGTSDRFTLVMHWLEKNTWKKISMDNVVGIPEVEELDAF